MAILLMAHLSVRRKNAEDQIRFRDNLFAIFGPLVLVLVGIPVPPGGFSR